MFSAPRSFAPGLREKAALGVRDLDPYVIRVATRPFNRNGVRAAAGGAEHLEESRADQESVRV